MKSTMHALLALVALAPALPAADETHIAYEVVGQVLNPSPQQSLQYGYLNRVRGLDRIVSQDGTVSEANALFTFYNDTMTERVINNGPMRLIDRTGVGTIYFNDGGGASFSNPDSFRIGKAIQSCNLRHQVIIDTSTGYFTTIFEMTATSATTFQIDGKTYRLGKPGQVYRLVVSGKLAAQAPPAAYIAGLANGPGADLIDQ